MERADVQGLVLYAYKQHPRSRFYLLSFGAGQPREWLRRVVTDVSSGEEARDARYRFNLAFSASGLRALGLDDDELATFQREFVQGMAHPERSDVLGDHHDDDPTLWDWGGPSAPVDAVALLYARTDDDLLERAAELEARLRRFGIEARHEDVRLSEDGREHFGFADGLAQPFIRGTGRRRRPGEPKIASGELVLGYANAYGLLTQVPSARPRRGLREHPFPIAGDRVAFGQNGSYLVLRKLRQRVAAFWRYCWDAAAAEQAPDVAARSKLVASRFIGRWPNGTPLVQSPDRESPYVARSEDFGFRELDAEGLRCPLGAHIRRANPRDMFGDDPKRALHDANLHRLVRRGRLYGPKLPGEMPREDDGVDRGLCFLALNANLRRQFEFVQQTWLNNCKFAGLSAERDVLVGKQVLDADDQPLGRSFTVQARPLRRHYEGLPKVVQVRGGEYFFLPGMRALNHLCDGGE